MTRLNLVQPEDLTQRHLVAEYKEITQFMHLIEKRVNNNHAFDDIPSSYRLNGGHCLFFYNKGKYISKRFVELYNEMKNRGIAVDDDLYRERLERIERIYNLNPDLLNRDYEPFPRDYGIAINRIISRIKSKPNLYPDSSRFFNSLQKYI